MKAKLVALKDTHITFLPNHFRLYLMKGQSIDVDTVQLDKEFKNHRKYRAYTDAISYGWLKLEAECTAVPVAKSVEKIVEEVESQPETVVVAKPKGKGGRKKKASTTSDGVNKDFVEENEGSIEELTAVTTALPYTDDE